MKKTAAVNLRMTDEMRAELQQLADEDGRELSAYIRRLLDLHIRAEKERRERKAARKATRE